MKTKFALIAMATLVLAGCDNQAGGTGGGGSRDQLRIVGSSTVFPFAKAVSEYFVSSGNFKAPVLESTGTGAGMSLFCSGVGADTPDIENASRRMKASEFELCQKNGVTDIVEINIGLDGIAVAQAKDGPDMALTPKLLYEAIAAKPYGKENPTKTWSDVDPSLPAVPISVYGPPSTSGTRDSLTELIMEVGCQTDPAIKALKDSNKEEFEAICHEIRTDTGYLDAGENDNLIVQKLKSNPNAVGIFGYSFLEENQDTVRGISLSGVQPTYDAIVSGEYPGARAMYIYLKKHHVGVIPGIQEFATEFVKAGARDGYLAKSGLIAAPDATRVAMAEAAKNMPLLTKDQLK